MSSDKYSRSRPRQQRQHLSGPHHSYNPSIHSETFELDKFALGSLQKECDGYTSQCESLKRLGIILNKYRLLVIKQKNGHININNNRLGLVGLGSNHHKPFHSMSIPEPINNHNTHNQHSSSDVMSIDFLAIYQQQVYDNHQPMMNLNKTNSMYDFVNFKLGENYNNKELLNDFHHLLYQHCSDKQYEEIYNYLVQQIGTKCIASTCNILQRNNNEFNLFNQRDSIEEISARQTINQIHCYFLHSYDIGYKFNEKQYKTINQYNVLDNKSDVSENEINSQCVDERLSILCKMINKKHQYISRHAGKDKGKQIVHKTCDKYSSFMNLTLQCKKFYYWDYYKAKMEIDTVNGGFISDWYVMHKYKDLKQELYQNKLNKKAFEYLLAKTKDLMTTNKVRKLKASCFYGNTQLLRRYNINKRAPITLNHILVLLLFCNHSAIQSAFTQSFFAANMEDFNAIIQRHSQFAHFSKYLRECAEIYGQSLRSADKFYHIVYGQYLFTDSLLNIYSPLSMTESLYVSCNINMEKQQGLIIQLSRYHTSATYFDCQWISNFCNENEKLFFSSTGPLRIVTILDAVHSQNYHQYISGMNYLNNILHGDKDDDSPSKYGKKAMVMLMQNQVKKMNKKKRKYHQHCNIPQYVDNLFSNYCSKKMKWIEIDLDQMNDRYYSLKKQLMTKDDSWIDLDLLCNLFVNVTKIIIKDGPYLTDYTFKRLLSFMDGHMHSHAQSNLTKIVFKYPKEEGISVEEGIKKYYDAIKYRNWDTFFYQSPFHDLITMYFVNNNIDDKQVDIDQFAFELWQQLIRNNRIPDFDIRGEINGNYLLSHIQQHFPNRFASDDDILIMINELVKYQYLLIIYDMDININTTNINLKNVEKNKTHFRYKFETDKWREFVKKSEGWFRTKWTIGSNVKIFSSHHSQWKLGSVVAEIGDIMVVAFKGNGGNADNNKTYNKTVDRYQQNIVAESYKKTNINIKPANNRRSTTGTANIAAAASYYYHNNNLNSNRWSDYYGSHTSVTTPNAAPVTVGSAPLLNFPETPVTNIGTRGSSTRVSFGAVLKRPMVANTDSYVTVGGRHEIYESGMTGISEITPRTSAHHSHRQSSRRSTHESLQPEFAPCKGDPFWDYYRTIGDMSRANFNELIKVMRWISAEDIMRQLLQNWLHKKIEPIELPYANAGVLHESNFNLHATSVIAFVRQSLNSKQHPNCFDIPELTRYYEISPFSNSNLDNIIEMEQTGMPSQSVSTSSHTLNSESNEQPLNVIGQIILSFLDQTSFLNACSVSRAWLFCSRSAKSRSHIKFRLWNAVKFLIEDSNLMLIITGNNDIVSITKFMRERNDIRDQEEEEEEEQNDDSKGKEKGDTDVDYVCDDVLINYAAGNAGSYGKKLSKNSGKYLRKRSTNHDGKNSLPQFFSRRINCCLFENIRQLQFDFTIPSHNKLIYYINRTLVDSYWDTLSVLFGIETLEKLDILFPDPHILLVAYILQNSLSYSKNSKRIMFPSIGVPKSKFVIESSKKLKSIRFAVKSLTLSKLEEMLNIHFEHYYHPIHHKNVYKYHALDDAEYAQYVYSQSNKKMFSRLDIYKLCRKIIHKSLIFDISNALYSLNHSLSGSQNSKLTQIQEISLCDVKCLTQELSTFLNNNASNLKSIDLMFTQKCLCPQYIASKQHSNSIGTAPKSPSLVITPSGHTSLSTTFSSIPSMRLQNTYSQHSDSDNSLQYHRKKNKKKDRSKKTVSELFDAILKYLKKQTAIIHEHNHKIKKKFKLAKKKSNQSSGPKLKITYANKLKFLSLESFSFSFPFDMDLSILDGFCQLFKFFELNDCLEISLKNLYLDGGCLTPFTSASAAANNNSLTWSNLLSSQTGNIEILCMKRVLYSSAMFFENFSVGFVACLKKIDLQIIYGDEYDDPYLHSEQGDGREPIAELLQSLSQCQCLEILILDLIQHHENINDSHSEMIPQLDIQDIDHFIKHENIQKNLKKLNLTFNQLSTAKYEQANEGQIASKFIRRNHLNLGSILRINNEFKDDIETLIMQWFGECLELNKIRLIRHIDFQNIDNHSNRYKIDQNIDFQNKLPFKKKSKVIIDQTKHNLHFYGVSKKKKIGDFYRGEVFGELAKILQPQNPVE